MKKIKIVKSKEEIVREGIYKFNLESEIFESLIKKFGEELLLKAFKSGLLSESLRILKEGGLKQGDKKFGHQGFYHYIEIEDMNDFLESQKDKEFFPSQFSKDLFLNEFYFYAKLEETYNFLKFKEYLICFFITNASVNVLLDESASFVEKHNARILGSIACIIYEELSSEYEIDFVDENEYEDEDEDEDGSISFNIFEL